jgi:hyperosmotically inducible protein
VKRAAALMAGVSLVLAACGHSDATPDARGPMGATEPQSGESPTPPMAEPGSGTPSSGRRAINTTTAQPTEHVAMGGMPADPPTPLPAPAPAAGMAPNSQPDADNTGINKRDRSGATMTPLDQGNNPTDLKITQTIRKAVMHDGSLSFTAKNVKIITSGAKVVLRGPVKSMEERADIEAKARATAGVTDVDDELEVKQ